MAGQPCQSLKEFLVVGTSTSSTDYVLFECVNT